MTATRTIGIDLGGTKILGRAVELDRPREALAERRVETPSGADAVLDAVADLVGGLRRDVGVSGPVEAVGVGAAGLVDLDGVLRVAPNLPGLVDVDFAGLVGGRVGLPVVVDNDANCATWAEHEVGAAVGSRHAVLVTLGTGIGGGEVRDGRLERGAFGFAGEPGHMRVDPVGPPCPCGRRGCWERFASGSGLGRLGREAAEAGHGRRSVELAGGDPEAVRGEHVGVAAREGDADALAVLHEFAWWVALGIANLVDVLDPEVVVVGGGLADLGELLLAPVRDAFAGLVLGTGHRPLVRIATAVLGPEAGAIGAALLAADVVGGGGIEGAMPSGAS